MILKIFNSQIAGAPGSRIPTSSPHQSVLPAMNSHNGFRQCQCVLSNYTDFFYIRKCMNKKDCDLYDWTAQCELLGEIYPVNVHTSAWFVFKHCFPFSCQQGNIPRPLTNGIKSEALIQYLKE